ncbi:MAG: hypothetical protein KKH44_11650 [Bacteroidetes bacterium]|nr:hypothetical protein [Bacteroidota bacterium]
MPAPTLFETHGFSPLTFQPHENVAFAVERSRQLLGKKTDEKCMMIAKKIAYMDFIIQSINHQKTISTIKNPSTEKLWQFQSRELFSWMGAFDLSNIGVKSIEWYQLFAVKNLMLCAEYTRVKSVQIQETHSELQVAQIERWQQKADQMLNEIVDCLARCESLELHGRIATSAKQIGSKGGKARSLKQAPLVNAVIRLFLASYQHIPVLTAATCIEAELNSDQPELLLLTKSKEKERAIQNIIINHKKGRIKILV